MKKLESFQRKYLRGLAHDLKPVVFIGQKGITDALKTSINEALDAHELIKLKFVDFKEKEQKTELAEAVENLCGCQMAGMVGHVAIFYRQHKNPEKRNITVPQDKKSV